MAINMSNLEQWQRAAQRALAADLTHQLRQRGASILVPSKSRDGAVYHVQVIGQQVGTCDCPAGLNGRPCTHRAAVAIRLFERQTGARVAALKPGAALAMTRTYLREGGAAA